MKTRVTALAALLLVTAAIPSQAQEHRGDDGDPGTSMPEGMIMVMRTDDAKVFRLMRPTVAALQAKLAEGGLFDGHVNGLYGPSTRDAVAAFQRTEGLGVTGLPGLRTSLALLGLEPDQALAAHAGRLDLESDGTMIESDGTMIGQDGMDMQGAAQPMDHGKMAMMEEDDMGEDDGVASPSVEGDPAYAKSLMLMAMSEMVMDNEHTRAVQAARELVGAVQIKLTEGGFFGGTIDGFPETERMREAVSAYQRASGLKLTGGLDFSTALALLGLDRTRVEARLGDRVDLDHSPVAPDRALMEESSRRFQNRNGELAPGSSD